MYVMSLQESYILSHEMGGIGENINGKLEGYGLSIEVK